MSQFGALARSRAFSRKIHRAHAVVQNTVRAVGRSLDSDGGPAIIMAINSAAPDSSRLKSNVDGVDSATFTHSG